MRRLIGIALVLLALGAAPAAAQAVGPVLNHCIFEWTDAEPSLASFTVYVATTAGGAAVKLGSLAADATKTTYVTGNLCGGQPDGQKYAVVKAVDLAGNESPGSNEVPFVLKGTVPTAPTNLKVR